MKTTKDAALKVVAAKKTTKKATLSKAERSEAARRAAQAAWKTMKSKQYQSAAKKGKPAVQAFLSSRKAA